MKKLKSGMIYPVIVLFIAVTVIIVMSFTLVSAIDTSPDRHSEAYVPPFPPAKHQWPHTSFKWHAKRSTQTLTNPAAHDLITENLWSS